MNRHAIVAAAVHHIALIDGGCDHAPHAVSIAQNRGYV
jgi:hypothetical protein